MEGSETKIMEPSSTFYRPYDGELDGMMKRTLTIMYTDFILRIKNRWIIVLEILAWLFFVPLIYILYLNALIEIRFTEFVFQAFYIIMFIWLTLICTVGGSGLISDDIANNTLTLYLSRPINKINYFLGKFGSIFLLISTISLIPSAVLGIAIISLVSESSNLAYDPVIVGLTLIGVGFLIAFIFSAIAMIFSSLTKNHLYAGVGIFCTIFFSNLIPGIIFSLTENKHINLISIWYNLVLIGDKWSGFDNIGDFDWPTPFGVLLFLFAFCLAITWLRLNKMELTE